MSNKKNRTPSMFLEMNVKDEDKDEIILSDEDEDNIASVSLNSNVSNPSKTSDYESGESPNSDSDSDSDSDDVGDQQATSLTTILDGRVCKYIEVESLLAALRVVAVHPEEVDRHLVNYLKKEAWHFK